MKKWLVTGISGSGRIELLDEIKAEADKRDIPVMIHDIGGLIRKQANQNRIPIVDERILDLDPIKLRLLRTTARHEVEMSILKNKDIKHHFIGTHMTFRWQQRLIQGISFTDIAVLKPDAMLNVVHDVAAIYETNEKNPAWTHAALPNSEETQDWMIEEEFVTELIAEVVDIPMFLIARKHSVPNLADLFFTEKKRIYLSYPITAVKEENPELLRRVQGEILEELEELFVVFNPLTIEDMALASDLPQEISKLTPRAVEQLKKRTVERDFQFIDQSDAVVVFYLTEKLSPGVFAEIEYAHRTQKPVYMVFAGKKSPFLEEYTTEIHAAVELLMASLRAFAEK